jgi:hypothetical protein
VFTERACELAPRGLISLLLPSSLSDLDGYRYARAALTRTHRPEEPLCEYGEDAFESVVQPCFGLVAVPRGALVEAEPARAWRLLERSRRGVEAVVTVVPTVLEDLAAGPRLPAMCFGEMGLQTNSRVVRELLHRAATPSGVFVMPILEGRDVGAFAVRQPQLFMNPDPVVLAETRCRLRAAEDYHRVAFIVRQTAAFTIAAKHRGERFRNSLLAGFASSEYDADLLVGLLNSALLRAFHVGGQRDARQATFPQVKVAHLRRLPAPPENVSAREAVRVISRELHESGGFREHAVLDAAVFALYGLSAADSVQVLSYLRKRAPRALSV